ncbi:unnamed protein product [Parascedosporium putredinis]|uniref:NB-ARC domain-containing protein n=1 Tax=Parascedosporium putredinis TaxID=1442378 RepID=A0A9P1HBU8_9PEZI|nr:unnamed protein product [Parascedosporium putredinis]CAI8004264.1 unnamed protein product [Parascedosporium putredinis]
MLSWQPLKTLSESNLVVEDFEAMIKLPSSGACVQKWVGPFHEPSLRNGPTDFVGRGHIIEQVLEKVRPREANGRCQRTAIKGLGGVGKTQIALEVASRVYKEDHNYCVFWVSAVDAATFENGYREIGQKLNIQGINAEEVDLKSLVKTALSRYPSDWLLVIDNVDDTDLFFGQSTSLEKYLPFTRESAGYKGSILYTTRNHKAAVKLAMGPGYIIEVREMNRSESHILLRNNIGPVRENDPENTTRLLDFLCDLPLAIRQAGAYIHRNSMTVGEYLSLCQSNDENLVKLLSEGFEDQGSYGPGKPIATSLLISFEHIVHNDPLAAQYLEFMSFLAEKDIPESILSPREDRLKMSEAIGTLKGYAFISEDRQGLYHTHRLVRLVMRNWLKQRAIEKVLGPEAPETLTSMNNLASSLESQRKYKEAEDLYRQTLQLSKKCLDLKLPIRSLA